MCLCFYILLLYSGQTASTRWLTVEWIQRKSYTHDIQRSVQLLWNKSLTLTQGYIYLIKHTGKIQKYYCKVIYVIYYFNLCSNVIYSNDEKLNFQHHYSSYQYHIIHQKSFYADLMHISYYYQSWKQLHCLIFLLKTWLFSSVVLDELKFQKNTIYLKSIFFLSIEVWL